MALSDWTFDGLITVTNPADGPSGGFSTSLAIKSSDSTLRYGNVTGTTINGVNIAGIRNGKLILFMQNPNIGPSGIWETRILFRWQDASNHYYFRLYWDALNTVAKYHLARKKAGVDTDVVPLTNDTDAGGSFKQWRITYWSAAGKAFFTLEVFKNGNWVVKQSAVSDTEDDFTGAGTTFAVGTGNTTGFTNNSEFNNCQIYG